MLSHVDHNVQTYPNSFDDLDFLIVFRRSQHTFPSTYKYHIFSFMSFHQLSLSFKRFSHKLSSVFVPNILHEALDNVG